jgi:mono/diheme cytochrome c family protein
MPRVSSVTALLLALGLVGMLASQGFGQGPGGDEAKSQIGLAIAPVPLDLHGKNRGLVGLGSYIVNAQADCAGCHSAFPTFAPGGDPFAGEPTKYNPETYLVGNPDIFAPFVASRNLTPNSSGRPAGLTLSQFLETIRTGKDLKNREPHLPSEENDLLQIMPWPAFAQMTDRDLKAIYEYLSAIPCLTTDSNPDRCD